MDKKYGFIVEGTHDADKIRSLFLNTHCVVTNGTRFTNRTKMDIEAALVICDEVFVMTDPDESGDLLAEKIQTYYKDLHLRRILLDRNTCTQQKMSFNNQPFLKTGVENAPDGYINMAIKYYIEHPEFTGYPPLRSELKVNDI